jgi:hypothetical protein
VKRVDVSKLSPDQRAALGQFIRDAQTVAPQFAEMKRNAQTIFEQWLRCPQWYANEGPPPGERPTESWSGAPEVNYVESFER